MKTTIKNLETTFKAFNKSQDESAFRRACDLEEKMPPQKIITVLDHKTGRIGDYTIKEFVDLLNNTYYKDFKAYLKELH